MFPELSPRVEDRRKCSSTSPKRTIGSTVSSLSRYNLPHFSNDGSSHGSLTARELDGSAPSLLEPKPFGLVCHKCAHSLSCCLIGSDPSASSMTRNSNPESSPLKTGIDGKDSIFTWALWRRGVNLSFLAFPLKFAYFSTNLGITSIPYLTVRSKKVLMVNQDVVEDSGHSTKLATVSKKHCDYYLLDRLPQTLKNSAAIQEYLVVEVGLPKSHVLVGSRLPRSTQRPYQQPITHVKTRSEHQDQKTKAKNNAKTRS